MVLTELKKKSCLEKKSSVVKNQILWYPIKFTVRKIFSINKVSRVFI